MAEKNEDSRCTASYSESINHSLEQKVKALEAELESSKLRILCLQKENEDLRKASVIIQARAEREEELISNTLLKKIQALEKEKEALALNYEREEEFLTNDLSRKLNQLKQEKVQLEQTLEKEQECLVNKLILKIEKLEAETLAKQTSLEQLRREKVELENTLEQEQEALVNKLWKRMEKLEAEKRMLQEKLDQPVSAPPSPRDMKEGDAAANLSVHITHLRGEVSKLKGQLQCAQQEHTEKMAQYVLEEKHIREENVRLQRSLHMEMKRRDALCRHLSESESSLEMEEERHYSDMGSHGQSSQGPCQRASPIPYNPSPSSSRSLSPGMNCGNSSRDAFSPSTLLGRCPSCGQPIYHLPGSTGFMPSTSPPPPANQLGLHEMSEAHKVRSVHSQDRFAKPSVPMMATSQTSRQTTHPTFHLNNADKG